MFWNKKIEEKTDQAKLYFVWLDQNEKVLEKIDITTYWTLPLVPSVGSYIVKDPYKGTVTSVYIDFRKPKGELEAIIVKVDTREL